MTHIKLCLISLLLQDQSVLTESVITVYTAEGQTVNLTFSMISSEVDVSFNKRYIYHNIDHKKVNTKKYDIVLHPNILEFQIINSTSKDTGVYWLDDRGLSDSLTLDIHVTKTSCPPRATEHVCSIEGSSPILTFIFDGPLYYSTIEDGPFLGSKSRRLSNFTLHIDLQIYNVTLKDQGFYRCLMYDFGRVKLQVIKIWFVNQTDHNQIVGQEGTTLKIKCLAEMGQIITALKLESHGTIKANGVSHSVSYYFTPDRTDHLSKYKCMDSVYSSIMIEIELFIKYPPAVTVHYTNGIIQCKYDGVPAIYSVYRLDKISKSGELVSSINMKNETFTLQNDSFPYQINGRYECVVSNGIPDIDGQTLQTGSAIVQYEGAPVFAMENRPVKIGNIGDPIELSFHIYSYPVVDDVFLEKIGKTRSKKRKISNYKVLNATLLYKEFNNTLGVQGYEYLIKFEKLNTNDFQVYCITAINRLGASDYRFEIRRKDNTKRKVAPFLKLVIICLVLLSFAIIIVYVYLRVQRTQLSAIREPSLPAEPNHDDIGSTSQIDVSNVRSSFTNSNQEHHSSNAGASGVSKMEDMQSNVDNVTHISDETTSDFFDIGLLQHEATRERHTEESMSLNEAHVSNIDVSGLVTNIHSTYNTPYINTETPCRLTSQTSVDSGSGPSSDIIDEILEDGYENPYEFISQERQDKH